MYKACCVSYCGECLCCSGIIPARQFDQVGAMKLAICNDIGEASYDRCVLEFVIYLYICMYVMYVCTLCVFIELSWPSPVSICIYVRGLYELVCLHVCMYG